MSSSNALFIFTSFLIADFLSGLFHWWEDTYAKEEWWLIGKYIATPNKIHHEKPAEFTKGSYWHRNWTTIIPSLISAALLYYYDCWLWLSFIMLSQANEIHCWSHMPCNRVIKLIQSVGIIQGPKDHHEHHIDNHDKAYCVMSIFLNPVLDRIRFWRALEWMIKCIM